METELPLPLNALFTSIKPPTILQPVELDKHSFTERVFSFFFLSLLYYIFF